MVVVGAVMKHKSRRRSHDGRGRTVLRARPVEDNGGNPTLSPTAVAAAALRTGLPPASARQRHEIPREDETIRVGDPDDDTLANEYVGSDTPGGTTPTPDQNNVDEIGRAYGLQEEDSGALRSGAEVLGRRDRHRQELNPPSRRPRA
jgi:hypothetical protein